MSEGGDQWEDFERSVQKEPVQSLEGPSGVGTHARSTIYKTLEDITKIYANSPNLIDNSPDEIVGEIKGVLENLFQKGSPIWSQIAYKITEIRDENPNRAE